MSFSVIGSSATTNREVITAFNYDNTGKTVGNELTEYKTETKTYSATQGYQNIEISFDLGFYESGYDKSNCTLLLYSNNNI